DSVCFCVRQAAFHHTASAPHAVLRLADPPGGTRRSHLLKWARFLVVPFDLRARPQFRSLAMRAILLTFLAGCFSATLLFAEEPKADEVTVDKEKKVVTVAAKIAPRKLPKLDQIYPIEVVATTANGDKAHETLVTYAAKPSEIHKALEDLGLKA